VIFIMDNPTDPNTGGTPAADPNGGSTYTPPAAPVEPVVETPVETPAPEVGGDTGSGEQPGGAPVV